MACAAVIPCRDEAPSIGTVVRGVRRFLPTVFVVDDGSRDATGSEASSAGAMVLKHDWVCGKGEALKTGWREARRRGFRWVLTLDGDGQHSPEDIPALLRCAEETGAQLVAGNRMNDAARMPRIRRWVNRWMSRRISRLAGCAVPDSQCGFRLLDLHVLSQIPIDSPRFEIESEVLLGFARRGCEIRSVPVEVIYGAETSKIRPVRDTIRWFHWLLKVHS